MKFYDTCSLLTLLDDAFEERFICSYKTLQEVENIKTSARKDEDVKYRARKLSHLFDENTEKYHISEIPYYTIIDTMTAFGLEVTPDNIIVTTAYLESKNNDGMVFCSEDICCKNIAKTVYKLNVESVKHEPDDGYKGFKEVTLSSDEMAYFYEHLQENNYELLINEYLIIKDEIGNVVDKWKYTVNGFTRVCDITERSKHFGKIKPKDEYQACVIDSIESNPVTVISGKAGSGKTLLSLATIMKMLEKGLYSRVTILFNPTKTKGAVDMGWYSGSAIEKSCQNSIGNILTTKLGSEQIVYDYIESETIRLISMADCRGMQVGYKDSPEILYITEAQNTSIELIKLCLSRVGENCKAIIEGDSMSQVDSYAFEGCNNGMRHIINRLKGNENFGYVELQNVWRSNISKLCDLL